MHTPSTTTPPPETEDVAVPPSLITVLLRVLDALRDAHTRAQAPITQHLVAITPSTGHSDLIHRLEQLHVVWCDGAMDHARVVYDPFSAASRFADALDTAGRLVGRILIMAQDQHPRRGDQDEVQAAIQRTLRAVIATSIIIKGDHGVWIARRAAEVIADSATAVTR